jgi:hypothetical protein
MPKRKRRSRKKLDRDGRLEDARKGLRLGNRSRRPLVESYTRRYAVSEAAAWDELVALGYYDELTIEAFEREGVEWEYRVEPLSGDMFVVPKGIEDYELYLIHPIL